MNIRKLIHKNNHRDGDCEICGGGKKTMADELEQKAREFLAKQPMNPCMTIDDDVKQFAAFTRLCVAEERKRLLNEMRNLSFDTVRQWVAKEFAAELAGENKNEHTR